MEIRAIRTEADYDWALAEIEPYFENEPDLGTPESDRFEILAALIEAYEAKHWAIDPPDPIEAITYAIETMGRSQAELGALLGSRSRASEILNRKRAITMDMAYRLNKEWRIPAEILLQPYHLASTPKRKREGAA